MLIPYCYAYINIAGNFVYVFNYFRCENSLESIIPVDSALYKSEWRISSTPSLLFFVNIVWVLLDHTCFIRSQSSPPLAERNPNLSSPLRNPQLHLHNFGAVSTVTFLSISSQRVPTVAHPMPGPFAIDQCRTSCRVAGVIAYYDLQFSALFQITIDYYSTGGSVERVSCQLIYETMT